MKDKRIDPLKILHTIEWILSICALVLSLYEFTSGDFAPGIISLVSAFCVSPLYERTHSLNDDSAGRAVFQFIASFFLAAVSLELCGRSTTFQAVTVVASAIIFPLFNDFLSKPKPEIVDKSFKRKMDDLIYKIDNFEYQNNDLGISELEQELKSLKREVTELSQIKSRLDFLGNKIDALGYRIDNSEQKSTYWPVVEPKRTSEITPSIPEDKFKQYLDEYKEDNYTKDTRQYTISDLADKLMDIIDNLTKKMSTKDAGIAFENIVCKIIESNGFTDIDTTPVSNDDGVDVTASKGFVSYAIQCKCYQNNVGKEAVQQVYSGKSVYNKDIAVVVTNNYFSKHATETARKLNVELWDRDALIAMIIDSDAQVISDLIAEYSGVRVTLLELLESAPKNDTPKNVEIQKQQLDNEAITEEKIDFNSLPLEYKSALHNAKMWIGELHKSYEGALEDLQKCNKFKYEVARFAVDNIEKYYDDIK